MKTIFSFYGGAFITFIFLNNYVQSLLRAINFQSDGLPSTDSYISYKKTIPDITAFTLCTHIQIRHTRGDDIPLISYAVDEYPDELMILYDFMEKTVKFFCCNGAGIFTANSLMEEEPLLVWYHICISVDLVRKKYMVVVNDQGDEGNIDSLVPSKDLVIRGGGSLILGQEQDILNGGFTIIQSLDGLFGGYVFIQQIVPVTRMYEFASCRDKLRDMALISFEDLEDDWDVYGSTNITDVDISEICSENLEFYSIFPDPYTLDEATDVCNKIKGTIAVPDTNESNQRFSQAVAHLKEHCSFSREFFMWVGARGERKGNTTEFYDLTTNEIIRYTNFREGFSVPYGSKKCVFLDSHKAGKWLVAPCYSKSCVTCQLPRPTTFRMRGLCHNTLLDTKYILFGYANGKIQLEGIKHSKVFFDGSNWIIRDSIFPHIKGQMIQKTIFNYPLGLNEWLLQGDNCANSTRLLLMTSCNALQFTCSDGTCIDKMQRCDLSVDCPDQSDEIRCTPVAVPRDYIKKVPPPKFDNQPATINLQTEILSMQPVDTVNLKVDITIIVVMTWKDQRINMESLNYVDTMNIIHNGNEIWKPEIIFEDVTGSEADSTFLWQTFVAVMESSPLADDIFNYKEDEIYPGTGNSLKLSRSFNLRFSCPMPLEAYPFDSQSCKFLIKLQQITDDFVRFNITMPGVKYSGASSLKEYAIQGVVINDSLTSNFSTQMVTISLENLFGYYVSTAYIPTFLMVLICYTTFFYDIDDFQNRIMVSLTVLLVLATLFSQINQTTPKSSSLKLLDVWFISCIMMNFASVVILSVINYVRITEIGDNSVYPHPLLSRKKSLGINSKKDKAIRMNLFARAFIPAMVCVFIAAYFIVAVTYVQ